jgi:hypothetical protein
VEKIQLDNIALERQVLEENILSAVGLDANQLQIGIKGDPSLRETAMNRCRYESEIDRIFHEIQPVFSDMLLERGIFRLFIGFNNSEVRTCSIFDPLREEIHDASSLVDVEYIERHFPKIPYKKKTDVMRQLYKAVMRSDIYSYLPAHLQNLTMHRHETWKPMKKKEVRKVFEKIPQMRNLPEYYLRNFSISIVQSVVRLQFNCDGTQIIHAKDFEQFIDQNLP